ncbi:MAG: sulfatase-like hydrolase/transferase, partial [bacterium]|nr:sulfatase-like hydrolase/transferase [bacterium]
CTDVFFDAALDFIATHRDDPFFVYLPTNAPHTPLEVDPKLAEPYRAMGLDDDTAKVYGMVANLDENMGRLLARLDGLGLRDNTLVLFVGDNGPQQKRYTGGLRGRKSMTYEGGIRVPCFLQWPAAVDGGRTIDGIAAHLDVLPTVLAACGIDKPAGVELDGRSIMPLLEGAEDPRPGRRLYFQCHRGLTPKRYQNCAVVTQRYKLVGNPGTFTKRDFQPTPGAALELYDLEQDPAERNNLADVHPEKVAELRAAYDAWFDDVRSTRNFEPGRIRLGSEHENPAHLCRYQDARYVDGKPTGWPVEIEGAGKYELTVDRGDASEAGAMHVVINGTESVSPVPAGSSSATVKLPKGEALLRIWCEGPGCPPSGHAPNDTLGDVEVHWLGA